MWRSPEFLLLLIIGSSVSARVLKNGELCEDKELEIHDVNAVSKLIRDIMPSVEAMPLARPGLPPFLSHFVQSGSNLFYKPKIVLGPVVSSSFKDKTTHIIEEIHDEHHIPVVIEEPLPTKPVITINEGAVVEHFKPVQIPVALELPTMSDLPASVEIIVEDKNPEIIEISAAPELIPTEIQQPVFLPEVPRPVEVDVVPAHIPEAPELGPFVMPDLPTVSVIEPAKLPEPCYQVNDMHQPSVIVSEISSEQEVHVTHHKPMPPAPLLPPFTVTDVTVHHPSNPVVIASEISSEMQEVHGTYHKPIPQAPVLPPFTVSDVTVHHPSNPMVIASEISSEMQEVHVSHHKPIPPAPILPPFTVSDVTVHHPSNPVVIASEISSEMQEVHGTYHKPIPQAPVLPPFTVSDVTVHHPSNPMVIASEISSEMQEVHVTHHKPIPEAPILPPPTIPESPVVVYEEAKPVEPCPPTHIEPIPQVPALPSLLYRPQLNEIMSSQHVEILSAPLPSAYAVLSNNAGQYQVHGSISAHGQEPLFFIPQHNQPLPEEPCDDEKETKPLVHLVSSSQEIPKPYHPSQIPMPYATLCAQNIITERVLPNIFEQFIEPFKHKHPVYPGIIYKR